MTTDQDAVSRRNMLIGLGSVAVAGVAVAAVPGTSIAPMTAAGPNIWNREYWTLAGSGVEEWKQQLRTTFNVVDDTGTRIAMKLIKVQELANKGQRPTALGRTQAFVAVFDPQGKKTAAGDRVYTMFHKTGIMKFYLGPAGFKGRLEAIFN